MREVFAIGILIAGLWGSEDVSAATNARLQANAGSPQCQTLVKDIKSFQKAQSILMRTFVQKNETLAETLDLYSVKFQSQKGHLQRADYASLRKSGEAFRSHGIREIRLVQKFEDSSSSLLSQVIACLEAQHGTSSSPIASQ